MWTISNGFKSKASIIERGKIVVEFNQSQAVTKIMWPAFNQSRGHLKCGLVWTVQLSIWGLTENLTVHNCAGFRIEIIEPWIWHSNLPVYFHVDRVDWVFLARVIIWVIIKQLQEYLFQ